MKTLDEVIKAVHHCGLLTGFDDIYEYDGGCPYEDCSKCEQKRMLGKDVIKYLNEYRKQMTDPDGDHQQLLKCQALLADFYSNDSLTFSEVYDMDDKPVWMEWSDVKGWRLVRSYTSVLGVKTVVLIDRYGVDFVFSEDTFERCEVMVYSKEHQ